MLSHLQKSNYFKLLIAGLIFIFASDLKGAATLLNPHNLCALPKPQGTISYPTEHPRVFKHLSFRSQKLRTLQQKCSIDHRNQDTAKTYQYGTSFCHIHAVAELWNSYFPEQLQVDTASLSLQIWAYKMGMSIDTILEKETIKFLRLNNRLPLEILLHHKMMIQMQHLAQAGSFEQDLAFMQKYGFIPKFDQDWLTNEDVFKFTERYLEIHVELFQKGAEVTAEDVTDLMQPFYNELIQLAWPSSYTKAKTDPMKELAQRYKMKVYEFDKAEGLTARKQFIEKLRQNPLGAALDQHAIVVSGYDPIEKIFWIRDSSEPELAYYSLDEELFFSTLIAYFKLTPQIED